MFTGELFCTLVLLARHRRLRNVAWAQNRAGLAFVRMELVVVFAYLHGPFKPEGNYMALKETFKETHASLDFTNPLWQTLYPYHIACTHGSTPPPVFGCEWHIKDTWGSLP